MKYESQEFFREGDPIDYYNPYTGKSISGYIVAHTQQAANTAVMVIDAANIGHSEHWININTHDENTGRSLITRRGADPFKKIDTGALKINPAVHHPQHYGGKDNPYEAIKVIEAWNLPFNTGNTIKYIARAGKKEKRKHIEDLKKAAWYLQREIENLETGQTDLELTDPPRPPITYSFVSQHSFVVGDTAIVRLEPADFHDVANVPPYTVCKVLTVLKNGKVGISFTGHKSRENKNLFVHPSELEPHVPIG